MQNNHDKAMADWTLAVNTGQRIGMAIPFFIIGMRLPWLAHVHWWLQALLQRARHATRDVRPAEAGAALRGAADAERLWQGERAPHLRGGVALVSYWSVVSC